MVTREERMEQLYQRNRTEVVMMISVFLMGLIGGLWFFVSGAYQHVAAFIFFFVVALPLSYVSWRKTRMLLTFNEHKTYRRLIRLKGFGDIVLLCSMLGMMALFTTRFVSLPQLSGTLVSLSVVYLMVETLIDRHLIRIDDEHVVDSLLGLTKRERMKRKWEEE